MCAVQLLCLVKSAKFYACCSAIRSCKECKTLFVLSSKDLI